MRSACALAVGLVTGCAPGDRAPVDVPEPPAASRPTPSPLSPASPAPTAEDPEVLRIEFLGVGGYLLRRGDAAILTPPMYTNPDLFETTFGTIASDPELVERFSADVALEDVSAVIVGHGHYDHLLDLPTLWPRTAAATIYGNATVAHLLAAFAPEPPPGCEDREPPAVVVPRDKVVQLDDPDGTLGRDLVDARMCGGSNAGEWIQVPGQPVRLRALCSMHPDQIGPIHFAPGSIDGDQCAPPDRADDWLEGQTLAFLVDFLDEQGAPAFRVYYQDAPTDPPIGLFDPSLLREKRVDVALLNVGSYTAVDDAPGATLSLMSPRYTIGGHWEDFFVTQDVPPRPIIGHDIDDYEARAEAALGDEPQTAVLVDGAWSSARSFVPDPGAVFHFAEEPR